MALALLHLADLHLDTSFSNSGFSSNIANLRRESLRDVFKRALQLAREKKVDAVTIGGDLFEAETVSPDTIQFLRQQFAQLSPIRVVIAPGNHDPYTVQSPYAQVEWPGNVHIFREPRLTRIPLAESFHLWGAAHDSPSFYQPLLENWHLPGETPAGLLLHGTDARLTLGNYKQAFCPFTVEQVNTSGFSIALLGHIHRAMRLPENQPLLYYPGSPEPLGFDEPYTHSVLLAQWNDAKWSVEAVDLSRWIYRSSELDVSDFSSRDEIVAAIQEMWEEARISKKVILRVLLKGIPNATLDLDLNAIHAGAGDSFAQLQLENQTLPPLDIDTLAKQMTTTGVFVRRLRAEMEAARNNGDPELYERLGRALRFGLLALEGREIPAP